MSNSVHEIAGSEPVTFIFKRLSLKAANDQ